ncbi:MAG: hypothetical protein MRZ37_00900 [Tenericutes bacterium]|nr:hypothetical protein [Mycoplasmatota bacterium]
MNLGIRFSSPALDDNDYKVLAQTFNLELNEIIEIVENAPYEISILVSLLQKLLEKLN